MTATSALLELIIIVTRVLVPCVSRHSFGQLRQVVLTAQVPVTANVRINSDFLIHEWLFSISKSNPGNKFKQLRLMIYGKFYGLSYSLMAALPTEPILKA